MAGARGAQLRGPNTANSPGPDRGRARPASAPARGRLRTSSCTILPTGTPVHVETMRWRSPLRRRRRERACRPDRPPPMPSKARATLCWRLSASSSPSAAARAVSRVPTSCAAAPRASASGSATSVSSDSFFCLRVEQPLVLEHRTGLLVGEQARDLALFGRLQLGASIFEARGGRLAHDLHEGGSRVQEVDGLVGQLSARRCSAPTGSRPRGWLHRE